MSQDHYINFVNELSDEPSVYVEMQHDLIKRSYWTSTAAKGQTVHYKPYFQSYDYTVAVYRSENGTEGKLIGKYQYACCEKNSVTVALTGTLKNHSFTCS
ncbi:hypothetical protein [Photobacterium rosenbergii]|uniref:Uncharacterized protein n=1 Tax=Photobacterium rosenbergii TaxID=294936 RepID=A0ABU3ZF31_9GAMM|nr:hypothetical protein [Photobacterium rosenbergii]MDV5168708.1 hypothetical protein [Photobacterium rosenbergii]